MVLLLFPSIFLLFHFLLWLPWQGLPKIYWIRVVRVNILVLFLGEVLFNFLPLKMMFAADLLYMALIIWRYGPSLSIFWTVLIINGCWILSEAFSMSIEMIIWFLYNLLIWNITLICVYWRILAFHGEITVHHGLWFFDPFNVLLDFVC